MKLRGIVLIIAIAACSKTSDVGAMQDEALGTVNAYRERFDMLEARLRELLAVRAARLSPHVVANANDLPRIKEITETAERTLNEMKTLIPSATNQIQNAAKGAPPAQGGLHSWTELPANRELKDVRFCDARNELERLRFVFTTELSHRFIETNAQVDEVELWISSIELRPTVRPTPPTPTPTPTPEPENAPGGGSAG